MASTGQPGIQFFPAADATFLSPSAESQILTNRPTVVGPKFDLEQIHDPIESWTADVNSSIYPLKPDPYAPSSIPEEPTLPGPRYVRAQLAENERLRLSMLWYYTRDLETQSDFLAGLQEKAALAQESSGWEFAVIGILDLNVYIRLAAVGLELAILPRGETLCAHTVTQPPGNVFLLPNLLEDWRFRKSPYAEQGGLTAYAGVPLRMQHESGESVGLGSLCVASKTSQEPLSKPQQQTLARLADCVVADIVQCTRARRQRERHRMAELITSVQYHAEDVEFEDAIFRILRVIYPDEAVGLHSSKADQMEAMKDCPVSPSDSKTVLWEDTAYIDSIIVGANQYEPPTKRVVRFISAPCESRLGQSTLVVATKNFRRIFDDVDSWFIQTCASMISQRWQKHLLSEVIRAKEKFLRGMSHQLRTPIHGILGAAELLTEDLRKLASSGMAHLPPEVEELLKALAPLGQSSSYLETISTAGRELMSIVNNMISLNRWADIAVADRQYAFHGVDELETELVKGISATTMGHSHSEASIFFHRGPSSDCGNIRMDLNLLRDSVLPLINNAIQNTPEGMVTVSLSMRPDYNTFVVDVQDTGRGIPFEDQKRIFQLYEKVDDHSIGAGLGLTLATKFSMLLQGSIELVSSRVGHGSHFRATFRDVEYQYSLSHVAKSLMKLEHVSSGFCHLPSGAVEDPLSANLTQFLTYNGLAQAELLENPCLFVLDYVPELEQRQAYYSKLPTKGAAICLVPVSERHNMPKSTRNIIYVDGPFWSSTLSRALQEADELVAKMDSLSKVDQSLSPLPLRPAKDDADDECSPSDEGYGSMDSAASSATDLAHMRADGADSADSDSNSVVSVTRQANAKMHLTPPAPLSLTVFVDSAKPTALLVDDNVVNLRILQMYCKKRGLPYRSAADGKQAVDVFLQQQQLAATGEGTFIELVLMDLQMPVCDGINATQQIRQLERRNRWKPSVLMIVTGQDSQADRQATSLAGADDYLVKPIGMKLLDRILNRVFPAIEAS